MIVGLTEITRLFLAGTGVLFIAVSKRALTATNFTLRKRARIAEYEHACINL